MNIILLSGGSGKRLWPLSNDVRSKQFIKLFKNNDEYESMVQRVYRQITTVDADAKITIATSKSQASAIKNQLGEKASICVEPCRRDTFPAIALAATYLHDELGVAENEAVVVCPVDPYVDNTYYEAVKNLQELAEQGGANLTLMGIEPTYPSEKYGYIIPESGENVSKVMEFKEKPDVETAKKYLAQSALWNAGIFAFKLGYLLDKAHSMIDFEDYRDLFNKYDTLTKISFDYAVVEKESSIQVLRYSGDWKDVGTWNMMAEVMADKTKGKAVLDETCENTNVVNELNIPILCIQIISYIVDTLNLDVLLLAHVIHVSDSNDKIIIDELMKRLDRRYRSRVHVVDHLIQPYEARILLGGGKATITGRMHAAVSSINMGTVPICLSYSVKFKGVIGDDFDLNDYIYQCRGDDIWASGNVHVEVIKRLNAVLENRESILNNIASKLEAVKKKSMLQIEELF